MKDSPTNVHGALLMWKNNDFFMDDGANRLSNMRNLFSQE